MKLAVFIFCLAGALSAHAQTDTNSVVVHKDPRIDMLVAKQIEINETNARYGKRYAQGFRILVINTNNRAKALEAKTKVYQEFPELAAYLVYNSPFYKVKVGNFLKREDAEDYLPDIERLFPKGAYVVRDVIELKHEE